MATVTEESTQPLADEKPINPRPDPLDDDTPWIDYALHQAKTTQKTIQDAVESFIDASKYRITRFRETGAAHFHQTVEYLQDLKLEYDLYEDKAIRKIKEGVVVASEHPFITYGVAGGLGLLALKRTRRFLFYGTMRLLMSEESMVARADTKMKALKQYIDVLKAEGEKLERTARQAEEEFIRGQTKLRQAGKQIRGVIRSAYKIELKAAGLKDLCGELPSREATRFKSQVSKLASEAEREKKALTEEVSSKPPYDLTLTKVSELQD